MNEGKVLVVDLARCDPETRRLVGSLVTTDMEMAAMSRIDEVGVSGFLSIKTARIPSYGVTYTQVDNIQKELARTHGLPLDGLTTTAPARAPVAPAVRLVDWEPVLSGTMP